MRVFLFYCDAIFCCCCNSCVWLCNSPCMAWIKIYVSIFRKEHVSVYLVAELVAVVAKVHAS